MKNVVDIEKNQPHVNFWVLCVNKIWAGDIPTICGNKWVATVPVGSNVYKLQCGQCDGTDSFPSIIPADLAEKYVVKKDGQI